MTTDPRDQFVPPLAYEGIPRSVAGFTALYRSAKAGDPRAKLTLSEISEQRRAERKASRAKNRAPHTLGEVMDSYRKEIQERNGGHCG